MKHLIALILALALLCGASAMADQRAQTLLAVAVSELEYSATKGGYTKYGEWGGNAYGEWCSEFVSWCVSRADELYGLSMLDNDYPMQTSCDEGAEWFAQQGRYITTSGMLGNEGEQFYLSDGVSVAERPYIPQPGDLIYIEWYQYNRLDHVGIVEFVTQDADGSYTVHTIEGNNKILGPEPTVVARYTYKLDDPSIRGYGVLQEGLVGTRMGMGSEGGSVAAYQQSLKDLGFYDGDCAGKYGKATATATKAYQKSKGLKQTGEADAGTQRSLAADIQARKIAAQINAQAKAEQQAQAMLETAKSAIASGWFGEFDPYDEAAAWARLTADITVLDVDQKEKIYLSDGPDGERKTYSPHRGYFYGESVAVKVLERRDGWTKIEAYNDYDELEQGWVRDKRIKTVTPNQEYGLIVDKMTQRLYIYRNGKLMTTLLVSTGTTTGGNEGFCETASGEFLMCSATGGFWSGNLWCDQAIRFNGGDLIHLVPSIVSSEGYHDYSVCESALGQRASHGCIRVQRKENADGYNHEWIWDNLKYEKNIKLIVWDDDGRRLAETPGDAPVYYNPDGGERYHADANCSTVRSAYLPLTGITYSRLTVYPYTGLKPCKSCGAPDRPENVRAWNDAIDKAHAELGL
ncbi:MAG: CHAP domain-containing protein [Clostridia bacterium]|nr:CHAP domain-containing protein [Clostridia bacterium]